MPIHDWTRVTAGTFHALHLNWLGELQGALNDGGLPRGYYALAEQSATDVAPDVLTLREPGVGEERPEPTADDDGGGTAAATVPPRVAVRATVAEQTFLATPQRRLVIRHATGDGVVAFVEVVSPGNKSGRGAVARFVDKAVAALGRGLHLQVIDLFPPGRYDPDGLHAAIWAEVGGAYEPRPDRPLTLAAYAAGAGVDCYVEPSAVGMPLVDLPLFLTPDRYVAVPLEATYTAACRRMPDRWRRVVEGLAST